MEKIVIFGTGKFGVKTLEFLSRIAPVDKMIFCDNDKEKIGRKIKEVSVVSFEKMLDLYQKGKIELLIIAVSQLYIDEILKQCMDYNIEKNIIFLYDVNQGGALTRPENIYSTRIFSQDGEECWLREKFSQKEKGVFVDVGAYHPYRLSNTFWAYKNDWNGIAIEPDINNYKKLCMFRPKEININMGVSNCEKELTYYAFEESALNTFSEERVQELKEEGYICSEQKVSVTLLQNILDKYQIFHIDFLDLDVEGYELEVLDGIDFKKTMIDVILIEQLGSDLKDVVNGEICKYMEARGYAPVSKYNRTVIYEKKYF